MEGEPKPRLIHTFEVWRARGLLFWYPCSLHALLLAQNFFLYLRCYFYLPAAEYKLFDRDGASLKLLMWVHLTKLPFLLYRKKSSMFFSWTLQKTATLPERGPRGNFGADSGRVIQNEEICFLPCTPCSDIHHGRLRSPLIDFFFSLLFWRRKICTCRTSVNNLPLELQNELDFCAVQMQICINQRPFYLNLAQQRLRKKWPGVKDENINWVKF